MTPNQPVDFNAILSDFAAGQRLAARISRAAEQNAAEQTISGLCDDCDQWSLKLTRRATRSGWACHSCQQIEERCAAVDSAFGPDDDNSGLEPAVEVCLTCKRPCSEICMWDTDECMSCRDARLEGMPRHLRGGRS